MSVIYIDRTTPLSKLERAAKASGLRLKWRSDPKGTPRRGTISVFPGRPSANDEDDLPPAA